MAVTIKDVAKKAGVSYSTVSRALNDPNADKSDKKKRILKIAEEMGYVPNQAAIQLKMSRSYVIGLYFSTISKMSSPFVLHDVLTGVYSVVGSKYNVIVKGIDMHEPAWIIFWKTGTAESELSKAIQIWILRECVTAAGVPP